MWVIIFSFFVLIKISLSEVITLSSQNNIICVINGDTSNSTVYINPPSRSDFTKPFSKIEDWTYDDWTVVDSLESNTFFVTDKRWEDFEVLNSNDGRELIEAVPLSFSLCAPENMQLQITNYDDRKFIDFLPNVKPSNRENSCDWFHFTILRYNNTITLISEDEEQKFEIPFEPRALFFERPDRGDFVWKLHQYHFREASNVTEQEKSTISVNFKDNLCLSFYGSVDRGSYLDVHLEGFNYSVSSTIIGSNEIGSLRKWKRFEISAPAPGIANLTFFRGNMQKNTTKGYWAVDEISFCSKDIEIYQVSVGNESTENHVCEILNKPNLAESTEFSCNPGYLGKNCDISCDTVLGETHPHCEHHRICLNSDTCFCSWGSEEPFCNKTCEKGSWGLFCKNKCNPECPDCHPASGECIGLNNSGKKAQSLIMAEDTLTEADLPEKITLSSNIAQISLPVITKNLTYNIKFICDSLWCQNPVVKEENVTITAGTHKNSINMKIYKAEPFTNYKAVVRAISDKSIEKEYSLDKNTESSDLKGFENWNATVYSRDSSNLWVRISESEVPVEFHLDKVWYHEDDSAYPPKSVSHIIPCELWDNYLCAKIENLKSEKVYSIIIEAKRREVQTFSTVLSAKTKQNESDAVQNLKIQTNSDGEIFVSWNHPWFTNGPLEKFDITLKSEEEVVNYIVNVTKPEKCYEQKVQISYHTNYNLSVTPFNTLQGQKTEINAKFIPITPPFASNRNTIIETCSATCQLIVPKPEPSFGNISKLLAVPVNATEEEIYKSLKSKEWISFDFDNYDENNLIAEITDTLAGTISFHANTSLYIVVEKEVGHSLHFMDWAKKDNEKKMVVGVVYIILVPSVLTATVLLFFLLRLCRTLRSSTGKNYQEVSLEEPPSSKGAHLEENFTRINIRSLESFIKTVLQNGNEQLRQQFQSLPTRTRPVLNALESKNKNRNKDAHNLPCNF